MYEDDPQDKVFDVLGEAVFGDHPLGRAIIGRADVVGAARPRRAARLPRRALRARATSSWRPPARSTTTRSSSSSRAPASSAPAAARPRCRRRPTASPRARALRRQGDRAVPRLPRRARASRATTSAASRCACSTTSSAARRPRGCSRRCARSAAWPTASTRSSRCYAGTGPGRPVPRHAPGQRRRGAAASWPTSSSASAPSRRTAEELERSKENVKGRIVLALESTTARMNRLGSSVLADMPLLTRRRGRSSASTP